jgi:hypothetical protein
MQDRAGDTEHPRVLPGATVGSVNLSWDPRISLRDSCAARSMAGRLCLPARIMRVRRPGDGAVRCLPGREGLGAIAVPDFRGVIR